MPTLPCPLPKRGALSGRYVRLEPLDAERHAADLYASTVEHGGAEDLYRFLTVAQPSSVDAMKAWAEKAAKSDDPLAFAAVDVASGRALGRQSLMRIVPEHGVIEIGSILWGSGIARTRLATEALYLFARYVFDELGYRRFEWKCDDANEASRRAALRFGFTFEGVFRKHMWLRGRNRDTAWYSMLDHEWQGHLRACYQAWLDPQNFDEAGRQKRSLRSLR